MLAEIARHAGLSERQCQLQRLFRQVFGSVYLFSLAVSLAQTVRMAVSSPEPFGTASLLLLAKYQRVSDEVAVRLPGIWRWALVSVSRSQSQAYCSHLARYSLVWCANQVISS